MQHILFVLMLLSPCPFVSHAQDARPTDAAPEGGPPPAHEDASTSDPDGGLAKSDAARDPNALTPPSLLPDLNLALPQLPAGSEPAFVVVELTVARDGSASDAVVVGSAGEALDRAALEAVPRLRFQPAFRGETAIPARIPFRFTFEPAPLPPPPPPPPVVAPPPSDPEVEGITLDVQGEKPPRETTVHAVKVEEVQKLPGTNGDPLRAIENMPGVARPPFALGQLVIRGSAPEDSAIFADGIEVPFAYHLGGLASVIPSDALTKLDFRPGNYGAEYGRAMGGIIELELRSPRTDRVGGVIQVDAIDGRVMVEGPLGKRARFLVGARRSWLDAWVGKMDDSIRAAPVYYDGQAILEYDFNARTTGRLFFLAADNKMKLLFEEPEADDPSEGGALSLGTRFTRLGVRFDTRFNDDVTLRQTIAWGTNRFDVVEGRSFQEIGIHNIDARAELRARHAAWITSAFGIDARWSMFDVKLRTTPYPTTDEVDAPAFGRPYLYFDEREFLIRPALYARAELTPIPAVRIIPSVRGEYVHDTEEFLVDPRLSLRADLHPGYPRTTFKAGAGMYAQPPLPQESIEPFGTKGLKSNRSVHASAGIEQELVPGLTLSLEGFYKHLYNLVVARSAEDDGGLGVRFQNSGRGRVYGAETLLRYQSQDSRFFGWVAYTLSRSERKNAEDEPYHLFQWDQTHILTALGNFELGRGFSAGARFRYVTGSPYTPYLGGVLDLDAGTYTPVPGGTYSSRVPAFHALDLRVDKTWRLRREAKLIAYFELRNAYNRKNAEELDYQYDYEASRRITGLPLLPVIGLRGEL